MVDSKQQWKAWLYLSPAIVLLLIFTVWPIFNTVRMAFLENYSGLKAAAGKRSVSMVLTGPELLLSALRESNVTAYVDVTGLKAGEHELPVQLHIEETDLSDVTWISTPATVKVTLTDTQS